MNMEFSFQAYLDQGNLLYSQGRFDEAIQIYIKTTEINPRSSDAYNNWGFALAAQGRYAEAISKYQKAVEINPSSSQAFYNWGNALRRQMKYEDALLKYQKATEINPGYSLAFNNWGVVLDSLGRYDEAISKYSRAIEINPGYSQAYNNWGFALDALARYEEAITKYVKATETDPNYSDAYDNWGNALSALGRYGEAVIQYGRAISINPNHSEAYYNWGLALYYQSRYDEAIIKFNKAIQLNPGYNLARYAVALTLYHQGKYADAMYSRIQTLKLLENNPQDEKSLANLVNAEISRAENKLAKARTEQQKTHLTEKVVNMKKILGLFVVSTQEQTPTRIKTMNSPDSSPTSINPNEEKAYSPSLKLSPGFPESPLKNIENIQADQNPFFSDSQLSEYYNFILEELRNFFKKVFVERGTRLDEKYDKLLPILVFITSHLSPLNQISYSDKVFPLVSKMAPEGIKLEDLLQVKRVNKIYHRFIGHFTSFNEIQEIIEIIAQELTLLRKNDLKQNYQENIETKNNEKIKKAHDKGFIVQSKISSTSEEFALLDFFAMILICFLESLKIPAYKDYNQKVGNISKTISEKMKIYFDNMNSGGSMFL